MAHFEHIRRVRQRRLGSALAAVVITVAGGTVPAPAQPAALDHTEKPGPNTMAAQHTVTADVETEPVPGAGDADDTAIWVHPTDPTLSVVIGTDKLGGIEVYDLAGQRLQTIDPDSKPNNVDLRPGFPLGGATIDLIGAAGYGMRFYTIDPATRTLTNITAPTVKPDIPAAGICLYQSPVSGTFYAVANTRDGRAEQWELFDEAGKVGMRTVRGPWSVGTEESEGCVFDDERQLLFHSEEHDGIFRYGAEPDASTTERFTVDAPNDRLVPDVEGLALVHTADGGYLVGSSQGDDTFAIYRREAPHEFVTKFSVVDGTGVDGCSKTDGIAVLAANLGPAFPYGLFACHDHLNTAPGSAGGKNFKFVRLERILELVGAVY
ncbi:MAG: phytase [Acidimicrobiia bacterium]